MRVIFKYHGSYWSHCMGRYDPRGSRMLQSLLATVNVPRYMIRGVAGNHYVQALDLSPGFGDCEMTGVRKASN